MFSSSFVFFVGCVYECGCLSPAFDSLSLLNWCTDIICGYGKYSAVISLNIASVAFLPLITFVTQLSIDTGVPWYALYPLPSFQYFACFSFENLYYFSLFSFSCQKNSSSAVMFWGIISFII